MAFDLDPLLLLVLVDDPLPQGVQLFLQLQKDIAEVEGGCGGRGSGG